MAEVERRAALGEIRVEGRKHTGTVVRYGEVSPSHRERFALGSIRMADVVHLDLDHDRERAVAWRPSGGLELADQGEALELTAELPPIPAADRILEEIRSGRVTGLSVEFRAVKESRDKGIRVIESAELLGVGIVARPSYEGSRVEARSRRRRVWLCDWRTRLRRASKARKTRKGPHQWRVGRDVRPGGCNRYGDCQRGHRVHHRSGTEDAGIDRT